MDKQAIQIPLTLDQDRSSKITPDDDEYEWFKDVFMEWHPPQFSPKHDQAFIKWYKGAMNKELQDISHSPVSHHSHTHQD